MDTFNELLDEIETKIEDHRKLALKMIEDRQNFATLLKTLKNSSKENAQLSDIDKEEIHAVLDRLELRLSSVTVSLVTPRNPSQIEALDKVNVKIDELVDMIQSNSPEASKVAESYLNSCSNGTGSRFEALLLSCTSDDQKAVKERMGYIVDNIKIIADSDGSTPAEPQANAEDSMHCDE